MVHSCKQQCTEATRPHPTSLQVLCEFPDLLPAKKARMVLDAEKALKGSVGGGVVLHGIVACASPGLLCACSGLVCLCCATLPGCGCNIAACHVCAAPLHPPRRACPTSSSQSLWPAGTTKLGGRRRRRLMRRCVVFTPLPGGNVNVGWHCCVGAAALGAWWQTLQAADVQAGEGSTPQHSEHSLPRWQMYGLEKAAHHSTPSTVCHGGRCTGWRRQHTTALRAQFATVAGVRAGEGSTPQHSEHSLPRWRHGACAGAGVLLPCTCYACCSLLWPTPTNLPRLPSPQINMLRAKKWLPEGHNVDSMTKVCVREHLAVGACVCVYVFGVGRRWGGARVCLCVCVHLCVWIIMLCGAETATHTPQAATTNADPGIPPIPPKQGQAAQLITLCKVEAAIQAATGVGGVEQEEAPLPATDKQKSYLSKLLDRCARECVCVPVCVCVCVVVCPCA